MSSDAQSNPEEPVGLGGISRTLGGISESEHGTGELSGEQLQAECARLRQTVKQLEEERDRNQQALATLQSERDAYRRAVYAWALEQITDEDVRRYAQEEEGVPLEKFIGELKLELRVGIEAPLVVHYAVHEEHPLVFVKWVHPLPRAGF